MLIFRENKVSQESEKTMTFLEDHVYSDEFNLCCDDFTHKKSFLKNKMANSYPRRRSKQRIKNSKHALMNCLL